ncbi:MAG: isochorismatase family protein [Pseudomonadota bacterium]
MHTRDTALIIVDAQESFRHRPFWSDTDVPAFVEHVQSLHDGARTRGIPIVQVFHVADEGVFSPGSGLVTSLSPLVIDPDIVFHKKRHSALLGTSLDAWLTKNGIRRLIICGIRTEQCCETTARHAFDCGYLVDYVTEATLTFAMTDRHGHTWSPSDIKARTELVLSRRFARITTVAETLLGPGAM